MKKLLWVGDAACPSGFARATHEILDVLRDHFEITVLGINYRGDPHGYPYPIYAAAPGGDSMGIGRFIWMLDVVQPDMIVIQQDGWHIPFYMDKLRAKKANGEYHFSEHAGRPVVAAVAVDGKNFQGGWLKGVAHAIFWTQFALDEAQTGGYDGPASVIPLGVSLDDYKPESKREARLKRVPSLLSKFIVGNVNRNQPRKRWDLTIKYFAEWVRSRKIDDAYLYLHAAPTGDTGVDVTQLARYYGVMQMLALMQPPTWYGIPEDEMRDTYNCFDVAISTTQGEGMGLTAMEAMACGVPCVVPDWSAFGDWARNAALLVPCSSTAIGPPYVNVVGGVPNEAEFVSALDMLYRDPEYRQRCGKAALERALEPRFRWPNIGAAWLSTLNNVLSIEKSIPMPVEEWPQEVT